MADEMDEVLSLSPSGSDFSGFSEDEVVVSGKGKSSNPQVGTSKVEHGNKGKAKAVSSKPKAKCGQKVKPKKPSTDTGIVDLNKLTPSAIESLRKALGLNRSETEKEFDGLERENLLIQVQNDGPDPDIFVETAEDYQPQGPYYRSPLEALETDIDAALFDETPSNFKPSQSVEDFEWDLPQLKAPKLGDEISPSLAKLISTSCTAQCVTDDIIDRYKIPVNCQEMGPPRVNNEIFVKMDKRCQNNDKNFKSIQSMVATAMMPVVKLSSVMKTEISNNSEARRCISDAVTLLGQVQYNMSLRRRYLIRPCLKKVYSGLCSINTPITTQLFGDDIAAEMKKCDTSNKINADLNPVSRQGPYRGNFRPGRRGFGYNRRRLHPYNRRSATQTMGSGSGGGKTMNQEVSTAQGSYDFEHRGDASSSQNYGVGRIGHIRQYLQGKKVPAGAVDLILQSWSRGTQKQYDLAWRKWCLWCGLRKANPIGASEEDVLAYLSFLCYLRKSYSVINTHKCMIVQTLMILGQGWCSNPVLLSRFMKGVFVKNPPKPRYSFTWDVSKVLAYLKSMDTSNSLRLLTLKTIALLALSTAARAQTLVSLKLSNMYLVGGVLRFVFTDRLKTSKQGKFFEMKVLHYSEEDLCPMHTVLKYVDVTSTHRKSDQLFVSFVTYRAVTTSTLARWLKIVLQNSGISTESFKAHSFRSASVSAARRAGCSLGKILQTADWSSARTFYGFYFREQEETDISFSQAVLNM